MPPWCDLGTVVFNASSPLRSYPLGDPLPHAGAARARFPSIVSGPSLFSMARGRRGADAFEI
jgi:hypothetical protein